MSHIFIYDDDTSSFKYNVTFYVNYLCIQNIRDLISQVLTGPGKIDYICEHIDIIILGNTNLKYSLPQPSFGRVRFIPDAQQGIGYQ